MKANSGGVFVVSKPYDDFLKSYYQNQEPFPNPMDHHALSQYITDQIKNAVPGLYESQSNQDSDLPKGSKSTDAKKLDIDYDVFETHDFVIVRIAFTHLSHEPKKRISVNWHELFLVEEGKQTPLLKIVLPKPVNAKKTKFSMRNRILELQILKLPSEPVIEFEINDLLNDA